MAYPPPWMELKDAVLKEESILDMDARFHLGDILQKTKLQ